MGINEVTSEFRMPASKAREKPEGFEYYLGDYGIQLRDSYCGEPIGWGFKMVERMGEEKFRALEQFGTLHCDHQYYSSWVLITDWLTPEEAIKQYGPIVNLTTGPLGGFLQVTYGKKTFISEKLDPRKAGIIVPPNLITTLPKGGDYKRSSNG